jgi:outer membrane protein OmpA-like peptidoglycan-associated protein
MKLSHDRSKSVREYLVKAGIAGERIQAKGYGESNPIATNDTEDGRKANRRTEFVILEF